MKLPDYIGRGLLWLLVLILLPIGVVFFLIPTLIKAIGVAIVIAVFAGFIFLFSYLTRNTPAGKLARYAEQVRSDATSNCPERSRRAVRPISW